MADFKNPQQEPGTEKRLLLVFMLTFLVTLVFQPLLKKYIPQPTVPAAKTSRAGGIRRELPLRSPAVYIRSTAAIPAAKVPVAKQATSETETVIENDLYRITFTNRGAQVKSWILKKFDNDAQNGAARSGESGGRGKSMGIHCRCGLTTRGCATG